MKAANGRPGSRAEFTLGPWTAGINEKAEPGNLTATELKAAMNVLLDDVPGRVVKRYGDRVVGAMPTDVPARFAYTFKTSDGTEYLLISDGESIYVTTDWITYTLLISGLDPSAYLEFETAESKCWIQNGTNSTMWFDGTNLVVMDREYGTAVAATTDAGTDTTHIIDADLTQDNDYWNHRKVVITSGTYAGMVGTVTDFVKNTHTLTVSGFTADPGSGVSYKLGLIMPKGRIARYADGHLFIGATPENRSEIRLNRIDDPDTGYAMTLDNPRAWPTDYQMAITQDDGDQIWTFSPVYRNRILATKGTAVYRLEPDATFIYRPVLVSSEVGCRYQDCWAVKDELLCFMGNERSGLIDLYITDMVSIKPRHKDGRFLPSFEEVRRNEPTYKYLARASADQFETGEKSSTCKVSDGKIECRSFEVDADWAEIADTLTNIDASHDCLAIKGIPKWTVNYNPLTSTGGAGNPNDLPAAASPAWSMSDAGNSQEAVYGLGLYMICSGGDGGIGYNRADVLDGSKNTFLTMRFQLGDHGISGSGIPNLTFGLFNGSRHIRYCATVNGIFGAQLWKEDLSHGPVAYNCPYWSSAMHVFNLLLDKNGKYALWLDGVLIDYGTGVADSTNKVHFGMDLMEGYNCFGDAWLEKLSYDTDFKYDCTQMPTTLPATGTALLRLDYTRAPDSYGKFFSTITANGGTVGIKTQSSTDDITYSALADLTNGTEPGVDNATPLRRYLQIEFTLTRALYSKGPTIDKMMGGALWRMQAQQVGSNITAWRKYLDETTVPANTSIVKKMRLAKTLTTPAEGDFAAWATVTNNANIATVLSDVIPVTGVPAGEGRWVDLKIELNPTAAAATPNVENLLVNWQEGALTMLNLTTFMYKKRLLVTAISRTAVYNDRVFVLDTQQAWTKFSGRQLNKIFTFRGLVYGLSAIDANIYQLDVEGNFNDGTAAVDAYIDTGALDFGNQQFELLNIKIGNAGITSTVLVYLSYDGDTYTLIGTVPFTGEGVYNMRVPHGRIGRKHYIRLRVSAQEGMAIDMLKVSGRYLAEQ